MQIRKNFQRTMLVAGLVMAMLLSGRAFAQVLDQVPSDAMFVLKIKDLDAVSKKVAKMAKGLGLDQISPEWGDPLGALEDKAHLSKGISKSGDLAVVFVDPDKAGGNSDKSVVALIPVDDYQAFLSNFKSTEAAGGEVTKVTPVEGDEAYVAHWGNYAAVSPAKELLSKKPVGLKLQGAIAQQAETRDAILYVNIVAVRAKALPELKKSREEILTQVDKGFTESGGEALKKFAPVLRVIVNEYLDAVEEFLNDARGAVVGVNLTDEGISTTMLADFEPNSYIGKLAKQTRNTDAPLLAGLPDRKYIFFGGSVNEPAVTDKVLTDILDPIKAELAKIEEAKKFLPAIDAMQKAASSTTGGAAGWVAPTGGLGAESLVQQVSIAHGDAKAIHNAQRETLEAMGDLFKSLPQQKEASVKMIYNPEAKTVDGVKLDTYETKMEFSDDDPKAAQAKQMMAWIYGPNGQSGVIGEVDPKTLIAVQGGSDQLIADTIASAKANADTVSAQATVKAVAGELPKNRSGVAYLDLGTLVTTGIRYAKGLGLPVNVKLQGNLPPIGMTIGSEDAAIRADIFIPNTLVQGLVAAGMQAQQQMKNGPGGGL